MSIEGLDSLFSKLDQLGANAQNAIKKGMVDSVKKIQGDAKDLCPVDTGDLEGSIQGIVEQGNNEVIGTVATNMEHASYVEFGTGKRGDSAQIDAKQNIDLAYKQDWEGMPPQPYMYPALKQNEDLTKENITKELRKEIRKLVE